MAAVPESEQAIIGREREIEALSDVLAGLSEGNGNLLVLEGPAGIGKTRLLTEARAQARARDIPVLWAQASELESTFAYGVVRQLFERRLAAASAADRKGLLQGAAAPAASLLLPGSTGAPATGPPLLHALWWLTANLAAHNQLVLVIDDAQWADEASLRFAAYVANRLEGLPVLLLLSVRSGEPLPPLLVEVLSTASARILPLRPLTEDATQKLLEARLPEPPDLPLVRACFEATRGNPFLLTELIRNLTGSVYPPKPGALAGISVPSVARSVLKRVERLGPAAAALAGAAAIWAEGGELWQAAEVAGIDAEAAGRAADRLAAAGILKPGRPLRFEHPLVRSAVYDNVSPADRSRGHRRVAAMLHQAAAPAEQVASHLALTEPAADLDVVQMLTAGADAALERGAPEAARRYLQRALREPPGGGVRGEVLHRLGVAELRMDPASAVRHLSDALAAAGALEGQARVALDLITAHLHAGTVSQAEAAIRPILGPLYRHHRELALRLEAELLIALRQGQAHSPLLEAGLDRWRGKLRGDSPAERMLISQIAVRAALTGSTASEVADLAETALGGGRLLEDVSSESVTAYVPLYPLLCADRFDVAREYLDRAQAGAADRGSPVGFALAASFRAQLALALGDLEQAVGDASSAVETFTGLGFQFLVIGGVEPAVSGLIEMDRLAEADALLGRYGLEGPLPDTVPGRILLSARGRLRLAQGRVQEAIEDLGRLAAIEQRKGASNLYLVPYQPWLAQAMAGSGRDEEAKAIAERQVEGARRWGSPRILAHNLVLAGRLSGTEDGLAKFEEAVALTEDSPARLVRALALVELGSALRRIGRRTGGIQVLRRGLDLAHRCGAGALASRAREELLLLGTRPRRPAISGVEALTAAERRVAEMAAAGLTNRQIAERLFLTGRTVEHHLTHCYQKLGIASRTELASHFAATT